MTRPQNLHNSDRTSLVNISLQKYITGVLECVRTSKAKTSTDALSRPIKLGKHTIVFRPTAPGKLFWANRPTMRVGQALGGLRNALADPYDRRSNHRRRTLPARALRNLHAFAGHRPVWAASRTARD
jgi:hypothetical protein